MNEIKIITNLKETTNPKELTSFSQVVGYSLFTAFRRLGVDVVIANWKNPQNGLKFPESNHTIIIPKATRDRYMMDYDYNKAIDDSTKKSVNIYIDADFGGFDKYYDHIFTVVKPTDKSSSSYQYAGWGADPELFKPEQTQRTAFLDSYCYLPKYDVLKPYYAMYEQAFLEFDINLYRPIHDYHGGGRITWSEMQSLLSKSHFFCCTQLGESGLPRIESATCGALLVVPGPCYMERTMGSLNHAIWNTKDELIEILKGELHVQENREVALKHSWENTATRIIDILL